MQKLLPGRSCCSNACTIQKITPLHKTFTLSQVTFAVSCKKNVVAMQLNWAEYALLLSVKSTSAVSMPNVARVNNYTTAEVCRSSSGLLFNFSSKIPLTVSRHVKIIHC